MKGIPSVRAYGEGNKELFEKAGFLVDYKNDVFYLEDHGAWCTNIPDEIENIEDLLAYISPATGTALFSNYTKLIENRI